MDSDSEPPDFKSRPLMPCSRIPPTENHISTGDSEWGSADPQPKCLTLKKRLWSDTGLNAEWGGAYWVVGFAQLSTHLTYQVSANFTC